MFDKAQIAREVLEELKRENFDVIQTEGSFDVVAKRDKQLFLIKILMNVDSLSEEQGMSLRAVAYFTNSQPVVIANKNNRENLDDDVIYSRFEIPVMTPKLLKAITMQEDVSIISSAKGRHTVQIDTGFLRSRRQELGLTLEDLAEKVGLSKKAIYEIENQRVNPTKITADNLEKILNAKLQKPYEIKPASATYLKPKSEVQRKVSREFSRIGIDNSSVYSSSIENVGRNRFTIMTSTKKRYDKIENQASKLRKISHVLSSKAMFVLKKSKSENVSGVPIVLESDLPGIISAKELKKIIEEKE